MVRAPLGMANDDGSCARVSQHLGRNIARMGPTRLRMAILTSQLHPTPLRRGSKWCDQGRRRGNHDVYREISERTHMGIANRQNLG